MAIPDCKTCPCWQNACISCPELDINCPGVGDCGSNNVTLRQCPTDLCVMVKSGIPFDKWPESLKDMLEEMMDIWEGD